MERYAIIHQKFPREFVLLQGTGCRWGKCVFCDYHTDVSDNPFDVNKEVLAQVTGRYGVLDVINSGSGIELDDATIALIKQVVEQKNIHTIWFEMHYMYRNHLEAFAQRFAPTKVKFRCGIETFDADLRDYWQKGVSRDVTPEDVARYFQGVCLLCGTEGEPQEHILNDIKIAKQHFEYMSINLFNENSTCIKRDEQLQKWFVDEVYHKIKDDFQIEVLLNNTDLGVG
ncbi:MAG: hypothetical protein IKV32_05135 [Muribaculaceae bacterium]|nr:hypothetical protein [Muribaculaceae bacterium]